MNFGQRSSAFENQFAFEVWIGKKLLEQPANPEVLLYDCWLQCPFLSRCLEEFVSLVTG